jgi:hypothetical protein
MTKKFTDKVFSTAIIWCCLVLLSCSDDPYKGLSTQEKLVAYEKIKKEILMRFTCNYFINEVFEFQNAKQKGVFKRGERYFYQYPLHFYGARDDQQHLLEENLKRKKVPKEYWDVSTYRPFEISELPCQEKIVEREKLKKEWQSVLEKSYPE